MICTDICIEQMVMGSICSITLETTLDDYIHIIENLNKITYITDTRENSCHIPFKTFQYSLTLLPQGIASVEFVMEQDFDALGFVKLDHQNLKIIRFNEREGGLVIFNKEEVK